MTVYELNNDELNELKEMYCLKFVSDPSYFELILSHDIPNNIIYNEYEYIDFTEDDFFCNN